MAHTNSTTNYSLPQWVGSDKPTFLGDLNTAFSDIDGQMKTNADNITIAKDTADNAQTSADDAQDDVDALALRVDTAEGNITTNTTNIGLNTTAIGNLSTSISTINTALDGKQATITGGASTVTTNNLTASKVLVSDSSGKISNSTVSDTEVGYLSGVTSNIQTQFNNKADKSWVHATRLTCTTSQQSYESSALSNVSEYLLVFEIYGLIKFETLVPAHLTSTLQTVAGVVPDYERSLWNAITYTVEDAKVTYYKHTDLSSTDCYIDVFYRD